MNLSCIVIDDEPLALEKINHFLAQIPYITCIGSFGGCLDAIPNIEKLNPDIIFLDIEMEHLTGIQFLETTNIKPYVIIISAYDNYAIQGYELNVFDYILKPYSLTRLIKSIEKVKADINLKNTNSDLINNDFIFIKTDYRILKIKISDIIFIEGMRDYRCLHTKQGKILSQFTFTELHKLLPETQFVRIHKSFSINIAYIDKIEKHRVYINSQVLSISETYRQLFYNKINI